jgi:hypothetical protein
VSNTIGTWTVIATVTVNTSKSKVVPVLDNKAMVITIVSYINLQDCHSPYQPKNA